MDAKKKHITSKQKELLINFLNKHPEMNSGKFSNTFTRESSKTLWIEISNILNSIPGAPAKDYCHWKKTWTDIKKNTKIKLSNNRVEMTATGGGIPNIIDLSDNDKKILEIVTPTAVMGDDRIPKPNVLFDYSDMGVNSENIEIVNEDLSEDELETVDEPQPSTSGEENKNKRKYVSKSARLTKSLEHGAKLLETSQNKVQIKNSYYDRKLAIMEKNCQNKEWFMRKQVRIGEQALHELREIKEILKEKFC